MQSSLRWLLPLSLALTVVACAKPAADATATNTTAATPADAPATAAPPATPAATSDQGDDFTLTMGDVDAYFTTIGKISAMTAAKQKANGGAEDDADDTSMDGSESVDQYIARLDANPHLKALVTSGGMSVSDFAHTNESLMGGMMVASALKAGSLKKIPDGINPQYVEFAQQHKAEIDAKLAEVQKQYGGG